MKDTKTTDDMGADDIEREVKECHQAFGAWISGTGDRAEAERGLRDRLDPEGTYITVSGRVRTLGDLLEEVTKVYGFNPEFSIETGEIRVVDATADRFVVLYEERTKGAQQSRSSRHTRWVTAVLVAAPTGGFRWMHIHEVQVGDAPIA